MFLLCTQLLPNNAILFIFIICKCTEKLIKELRNTCIYILRIPILIHIHRIITGLSEQIYFDNNRYINIIFSCL